MFIMCSIGRCCPDPARNVMGYRIYALKCLSDVQTFFKFRNMYGLEEFR